MPMDNRKMIEAAITLSSVDAWHSPTNASQSSRAAVLVTAGSGPAPIEWGSNRATIGASEPFPGPHVPPAAGAGRATSTPVTAKAAPKIPMQRKISLILMSREERFTVNTFRAFLVGAIPAGWCRHGVSGGRHRCSDGDRTWYLDGRNLGDGNREFATAGQAGQLVDHLSR
jgi:hypothetical protein